MQTKFKEISETQITSFRIMFLLRSLPIWEMADFHRVISLTKYFSIYQYLPTYLPCIITVHPLSRFLSLQKQKPRPKAILLRIMFHYKIKDLCSQHHHQGLVKIWANVKVSDFRFIRTHSIKFSYVRGSVATWDQRGIWSLLSRPCFQSIWQSKASNIQTITQWNSLRQQNFDAGLNGPR